MLASSSPMNINGICGHSSCRAMAASSARGSASVVSRSPKARLPIWSWFCRNRTNAVGGSAALAVPRDLPPRCADGSP